MTLPPDEARRTLEFCLRASRAEASAVTLTGRAGGHVRFARGEPSTAGASGGVRLTVRSFLGRRSGAYTTNQTDPPSLEAAVRASETIAGLLPEDPEFLPPLGPQSYASVEAWSEATAAASAEARARLVGSFANEAASAGAEAAGLCATSGSFEALATSAGLFAYHRETSASLTGTIRTADGRGSGWASGVSTGIEEIDASALGRVAAKKASDSARARELPPGKYTVILEPAAVADLLGFLFSQADARRTAEGRTAFSRPGGATALGEKIAAEDVTIRSDPAWARAPAAPFDAEGAPQGRIVWIENGILKTLSTARYWAGRSNTLHTPQPTNLLMAGGPATTESMVRATERGLLVTRFWYTRLVDPQTLLLTGITRDGLFLIEKGKVAGGVRNFRFNESSLGVLARADMFGPASRVRTGSGAGLIMEVPPLRSREFSFTSVSDAV